MNPDSRQTWSVGSATLSEKWWDGLRKIMYIFFVLLFFKYKISWWMGLMFELSWIFCAEKISMLFNIVSIYSGLQSLYYIPSKKRTNARLLNIVRARARVCVCACVCACVCVCKRERGIFVFLIFYSYFFLLITLQHSGLKPIL